MLRQCTASGVLTFSRCALVSALCTQTGPGGIANLNMHSCAVLTCACHNWRIWRSKYLTNATDSAVRSPAIHWFIKEKLLFTISHCFPMCFNTLHCCTLLCTLLFTTCEMKRQKSKLSKFHYLSQLIYFALLHARSSRWLPWSCKRRTSMKCMRQARASAEILRESSSSHACWTYLQKRRSISVAVCGLE